MYSLGFTLFKNITENIDSFNIPFDAYKFFGIAIGNMFYKQVI